MTDIERDTVVAVAHLCLVGTGVYWLVVYSCSISFKRSHEGERRRKGSENIDLSA